jgi:putative addiction module killer protein
LLVLSYNELQVSGGSVFVTYYETLDGKKPFTEWFDKIKDTKTKIKILKKLEFLRIGNFSNCKPVGSEVFERKMFGIRVYFLKDGNTIIVLLLGGEKDKQQQRDIEKAKIYAADFFKRNKKNEKE